MPVSPYIFCDKGTFEKRIRLRVLAVNGSNDSIDIGKTSASTIIAIFTSRRSERPGPRVVARVQAVLAEFGLPRSALIPLPDVRDVYEFAARTEPAF
jgi:hypothetical protein